MTAVTDQQHATIFSINSNKIDNDLFIITWRSVQSPVVQTVHSLFYDYRVIGLAPILAKKCVGCVAAFFVTSVSVA